MSFFWVWLLAASVSHPKAPGLIIYCEKGQVYPKSSAVAHGEVCVLHDAAGRAYSVKYASIFDDSAPEP